MQFRQFFASGFDGVSPVHICALQLTLDKCVLHPKIADISCLGSLLKALGLVFKHHQQDQGNYAKSLIILTRMIDLLAVRDTEVTQNETQNGQPSNVPPSQATILLGKYKEAVMKMLLFVKSDKNPFPVVEQSFEVRAAVATVYSHLAKTNPDSQWGADADGPMEAFDVFERVCELLLDKSCEARTIASRALGHFFGGGGGAAAAAPASKDVIKRRWKRIVETVEGLVESAEPAENGVARLDDDRSNYVDTAISILVTVADKNRHLSVTALFCLIQNFSACEHRRAIIQKLSTLCEKREKSGGFEDVKSYMASKVGPLLRLWIGESQQSPFDFPFFVAGFASSNEFVSAHRRDVVSSLLYTQEMAAIRTGWLVG